MRISTSECGPAWSGRVPWKHENAGSNPAIPTPLNGERRAVRPTRLLRLARRAYASTLARKRSVRDVTAAYRSSKPVVRVQLPLDALTTVPNGLSLQTARSTCNRNGGFKSHNLPCQRWEVVFQWLERLAWLSFIAGGKAPAGPHKAGLSGSIPGPATAAGPVLSRGS